MATSSERSILHRLAPGVLPLLAVAALGACGAEADVEPMADADTIAMTEAEATAPNTLSDQERNDGWRLLFDGTSFNGWRGIGIDSIPGAHWRIDDGTIMKIPSGDVPVQADGQPTAGGDLMTTETFGNFELSFEWRVSEAGNSGIKYNVSEELSISEPPATAALGFEYQILDDDRHPDANMGVDNNRKAAGLYDLIGVSDDKPLNAVGEWNHGRIIFQGNHGEHWLNGEKVLEYDLGSARMDSLLAASKYATIPGFADRRDGHIVLQDHNDAVWFRNVKIRLLD